MPTEGVWTPRCLIRQGKSFLGEDPSAERVAETVLTEILGVGRTSLYLEGKEVPEEISHYFFQLLAGLKEGAPLQYLLGKAYFIDEPFWVTPACFIPRPSTEVLVEAALDYIKGGPFLLMDVGTGSGCIAISLTNRLPYSKMLAIDISVEALCVARENGRLHGVSKRISWICGDLFNPLKRGVVADAILSNPPYIPEEEVPLLPSLVQREPRVSFDGGEAGLSYYRRFAEESPSFLREGGYLILEIGDGQAEPIEEIFLEKSPLCLQEVRRDALETPRIMIFRKDG